MKRNNLDDESSRVADGFICKLPYAIQESIEKRPGECSIDRSASVIGYSLLAISGDVNHFNEQVALSCWNQR